MTTLMKKQTFTYKITYPKRRPFFNLILMIGRWIKKKPKLINRNDALPKQAIFISNHSGASGPMNLALFFPAFFVPWGAHPMVGNYISRWRYLYFVFYRQKLGYGKVRSFLIATLFGIISKRLYRGMDLIPTYEDMRLKTTFRKSEMMINNQKSILVFPEDSSQGYHDHILKYHEGFIAFADYYYQKYNMDLPIYPLYFSKKLNIILIDKPQSIRELYAKGLDRTGIAHHFKDCTNHLYQEILDMKDTPSKKTQSVK